MENGKDDIYKTPGMSPLEALRAKYAGARNQQEKTVPPKTPDVSRGANGTELKLNGTDNGSTIDRSVLTIGESHALFLEEQRKKQEQLRPKTQGGLHSKPENPFGLGIPPTRERVKEVIRDSQTPSPPLIPVRPPSDRHLSQKPVSDTEPVFKSAHSGVYLKRNQ